ncbi:MAG: hypothetical protein KAI71_03860 [Candidatus Pacebacteria bacterium]|nr:hypothetical protein [Candidatus Paceibacterota bacterium]
MKENIYIRVIKFGIEHPEGFNYDSIINDKQLKLNNWEKNIVNRYLNRAYENEQPLTINSNYPNLETLFLAVETTTGYQDDKTKFIINLDSQFKYIDYLELKEARKTAAEAYRTAMGAIILSVISIIVMIFITQTIKMDQSQYKEIKNLIVDKSDIVK